MKKAFKLALVFLIITSGTFAQKAKDTETVTPKTKEVEADLPMLTNKKFIDNVWDYSKSKKFKYKGTQPIIIDFFATWCVPCKAIHPSLVELQKEYGGKVTIYQINVDKEPEITDLFKITNIPALVFMKDSKTMWSIEVGKKSKEEIKALIDSKFFNVQAPPSANQIQ